MTGPGLQKREKKRVLELGTTAQLPVSVPEVQGETARAPVRPASQQWMSRAHWNRLREPAALLECQRELPTQGPRGQQAGVMAPGFGAGRQLGRR